MYSLVRNILFALPPEISHELTMDMLGASERLKLTQALLPAPLMDPVEVMGIRFPNRVGLAAGLDKNGDHFNGLGALGFGCIEIGTVTPRPQPGNLPPRLFRLPAADAIINRMGFNSKGVDHLVNRVGQRRYTGVLGINIGKNADTPADRAEQDYLHCLESVYGCADYIAVNISSPNTPGLRDLQFGTALDGLVAALVARRDRLADQHGTSVPLAVKIAPDMDGLALKTLAEIVLNRGIDGVIATNTTLSRNSVDSLPHGSEAGGVSGAPLTHLSTDTIFTLSEILQGELPIIGVGGIMSAADARAKIEAGASLVQIYTGFIYRGPALIRQIVRALAAR